MISVEGVTLVQVVFLALTLFGVVLLCDQARFRGLVYLLLLVSILLIFNLLEDNHVTRDIYLVTPVFSLLCGPCFYWFIYRFLVPEAELKPHHWFHLLPGILALAFTHWPQWVLFFGTVSQVLYLIACLILIRRYHHATDERTSYSHSYRLDWLRQLLMTVVVIDVIDLTRLNLQPYLPSPWGNHWYLLMQVAFLILYAALIAYAVRRPELFEGVKEQDLKPSANAGPSKLAEARSQQQAKVVFQQLNEEIKARALYLKPRLTLRSLASDTGMKEKDISWAINQGAGKSFNDYINGLRLEIFKLRLKDQATNISLLDLALDCGFNSKSSFNAVFKQQLGQTPSQYLKSIQ